MMPLYAGGQRIAKLYRGTTPVARAYRGAGKVHESGGSALWTPAQLSPFAWYDAELSPKTIPSGNEVGQWNDISGNGRHATQGASANRPTYSAADKWLTFDGSNDFMAPSVPLVATGNAPLTMIAVARPDTTSGQRMLYAQGSFAVNQLPHLGFNGSAYKFGVHTNDMQSGSFSSGTGYVIVYRYAAGARGVWSNGTSVASDAYSSANWGTANPTIGQRAAGGPSDFFNGKLRTLLFFQTALSTDDRRKAEGYLAHLWGLTGSLPGDHPYKSTPPAL